MAIELATNSKKMKEVKEKLAKNIKSAPLYDTLLFTKHLRFRKISIKRKITIGTQQS